MEQVTGCSCSLLCIFLGHLVESPDLPRYFCLPIAALERPHWRFLLKASNGKPPVTFSVPLTRKGLAQNDPALQQGKGVLKSHIRQQGSAENTAATTSKALKSAYYILSAME
jgi:hypothetical protein